MNNKNLLILFSKWPDKTHSKSRISKDLGAEYIEDFCFACIDDLTRKLKTLRNMDVIIVPNTEKESELFFQKYGIRSVSLEIMNVDYGGNRSFVFQELFEYFLRQYEKVSLIPMDVPHIELSQIEKSFRQLETFDQVFGPEENGGVYLMGLKNGQNKVFNDVRWSTENSFNDLIRNCKNATELDLSFDLNTFRDILRMKKEQLLGCPALTRFIKSVAQERTMMQKEVMMHEGN